MSTVQVIRLVGALLDLTINTLIAYQNARQIIDRARAEGRDVSDEELAAIKGDSEAKTKEVLAVLDQLPGGP